MAKIYEEISKSIANSAGKTDANLANDANHLGGIPAEQYATQKYVQEYHNTKEASQKEYIDQRDRAVLQEAKEYTNSQIRNQDFSGFAKVTDVQALDDKLSEELSTGLTAQKNYTDSKIQAVVKDTNANFTDVNNAISTLNSNQNNLFQSVSNGKATVAAAITDKGVTTASDASFDTMAGNIRSIQTGGGGGEIDENFVNTSDATATASDILLGKTAYAQGKKVYGGLVYPETEDSSDATATPYDILSGKTAYVQGRKIQGILNVDENSQPSYDIGAVEKIYGTVSGEMLKEIKSYDRELTFTSSAICNEYILLKKSNSNEILGGIFMQYDKSTQQMVIETALYEEYFGVKQWVNKKRYTLEELGINTTLTNSNTFANKFSVSNFDDKNEAYLAFYALKTLYIYKIKLETEHTGNSTSIDYIKIDSTKKWKKSISSYYLYDTIFPQNMTNKFLIEYTYSNNSWKYSYLDTMSLDEISSELSLEDFENITKTYSKNIMSDGNGKTPFSCDSLHNRIVNNDKLLALNTYALVLLNDNLEAVAYAKLEDGNNGGIYIFNETYTEYQCISGKTGQRNDTNNLGKFVVKHFRININYNTLTISITEDTEKIQIINIPDFINVNEDQFINYIIVDGTNTNALIGFGVSDVINYIVKCKINSNQDSIWTIFDENSLTTDATEPRKFGITADGKCISYSPTSNLKYIYKYTEVDDYSKIVALKYEGDYYYKQSPQTLTAGQPDVRVGKTFIGWMGYPEIGTMEVESNE